MIVACICNNKQHIESDKFILTLSNCNCYDYYFYYNLEKQLILSIYYYTNYYSNVTPICIEYNIIKKIMQVHNSIDIINYDYYNDFIIMNEILLKFNKLINLR